MERGDVVDYEELAAYLRAMANPSRLELVDLLRMPHALPEIKLSPGRVRAGEKAPPSMSRQSIMEHLEKLMETGVVVASEPDAKEQRLKEYVVNPRRIYHITEEFRKLSTITVGAPAARDATIEAGEVRARETMPGPKLVLVHGALEGKAFALRRADLQGERGWVLGRKAGLHVTLPYDPYVSLENSEILADGGTYRLVDLRTSRNGTSLNWRRLGQDERAPLEPGDVIGVGRSLLVFRAT